MTVAGATVFRGPYAGWWLLPGVGIEDRSTAGTITWFECVPEPLP
jgi:hypothetical protein